MSMMIRRHKTTTQKKVVEAKPDVKVEIKPQTVPNTLSKTDINRMGKAKLVEIAKENGIKDAISKSGNELKKTLIEKFNL